MSCLAKFVTCCLISVFLLSMSGCGAVAKEATVGPGGVVLKALARFFGKESIEEVSEQLAKVGGKELFERAASKIASEGGEELAGRVATQTLKHGPEILRAIDNVPVSTKTILNALDEIPPEQVVAASRRLAAGKEGVEVASSVAKYGANALRTELAHPGIGSKLIRAFGDDGAEMVVGLSDDYAVALARHSEELAVLPAAQRKSILEMINKDKDAFFRWLGDFVFKNPGKIVFSTATAATLIASPSLLIEEVTEFGPDGKPTRTTKTGPLNKPGEAIGKAVAKPLGSTLNWLGLVFVLAVGAFAAIKLWGQWKQTNAQVQKLETESKPSSLDSPSTAEASRKDAKAQRTE